MHRRWPGSFVFRNASQRLRAVVLWLQQERPAREVYARYRGLFIPSPGCSRLSLSLSLSEPGSAVPHRPKWRHFRDATRLASMTRNAMTRHRDAYLAIFSPLPSSSSSSPSPFTNFCRWKRLHPRFDEVWRGLIKFDEVWRGLNRFEQVWIIISRRRERFLMRKRFLVLFFLSFLPFSFSIYAS